MTTASNPIPSLAAATRAGRVIDALTGGSIPADIPLSRFCASFRHVPVPRPILAGIAAAEHAMDLLGRRALLLKPFDRPFGVSYPSEDGYGVEMLMVVPQGRMFVLGTYAMSLLGEWSHERNIVTFAGREASIMFHEAYRDLVGNLHGQPNAWRRAAIERASHAVERLFSAVLRKRFRGYGTGDMSVGLADGTRREIGCSDMVAMLLADPEVAAIMDAP